MHYNRVKWASRRGMAELDLILQPFTETVYPTLDTDERQRYHTLLDEQDSDLFAWFLGGQICQNDDLNKIIRQVKSYALQQIRSGQS